MQKRKIKSITVFCGSNIGINQKFREVAVELARALAEDKITLIYGGAHIGLMGVFADEVLLNGGKVIGVLPQLLMDVELAHRGLTELHIVNTMHERKALMNQFGDAFILFPGGAGSLDEFFEAYTWAQLGYHNKPCAILNVDHYYDSLIQFIDHACENGFIKLVQRRMIIINNDVQGLLQTIRDYQPALIKKWIQD